MAAEKSKVIHVRSVGQDVTEDDLNQFAQEFGTVTKVVLLRLKNQALIQMEDVASAERLIDAFAEAQPTIRGRNVYIQFSSHQELKAQENHAPAPREPRERREHPEQRPNRILLITIHNPQYPITVDVLHQVFSPHGLVEKIVTFLKQPAGLQALLQFALQQSAVNARTQLQGRNIYDGCCTLDIQFSNLPELQVNYNSDKTRDYTNQNLPIDQGRGGPQAANMMQQTSLFGDGSVYGVAHHGGPRPHHGGPYGMHQGMHPNIQLPLGVAGTNDRRVVLVSNLNVEQVDPEKLFNLFSNYGNIIRIKMLQKKPDHALIEMAEGFQAELAVHFLKGVMLLGKQMDVNYSKHPHINPTQDAHDFSHSNLNRFSRNASKNFRHCCAPTKMIHCSSLPANVTEESITEYLAPHGTITGSKLSENNGKKQALVLFSSEEEATEALVQKHATKFEGSTIRLAFSKLTSL